jgi:hypothetical protein
MLVRPAALRADGLPAIMLHDDRLVAGLAVVHDSSLMHRAFHGTGRVSVVFRLDVRR